ncbi:unnamed protein product [Microthlaspi erraticum]|uniref:Homeobox domain-containing protein n=1 Tax=Microthlaspi erraticum TaxID=1685480 RepID=A0A6D2KTS7_9BRAS|nr:unnamed protein product [Microthlaspi erraticum]
MNGEYDFDDLFDYNNFNPIFMEGAGNDENDNVGAMSGDGDDDDHHQDGKRARKNVRHNAQQIQELEIYFMECPHPTEKRRSEIAQRLNMESRQIKFWFQNKRSQEKTQKERNDGTTLKQENDILRADNERLKQKLMLSTCSTCGGPMDDSSLEQQLLAQNARLKQELFFHNNTPIQTPAPVNPSSSVQPMIFDNPGSYAPLVLDSGEQTSTFQEMSNIPIQPPVMIFDNPGSYAPLILDSGDQTSKFQEMSNISIQPPVANPSSSSSQPMIFDNLGSYAPLGPGSGGQEISNNPIQPQVANPPSSAQPMILDNAPLGLGSGGQNFTLQDRERYMYLGTTAMTS